MSQDMGIGESDQEERLACSRQEKEQGAPVWLEGKREGWGESRRYQQRRSRARSCGPVGHCEPLAFLELDGSHWKVLKTGGTQSHIHGSLWLLGVGGKQRQVKRG